MQIPIPQLERHELKSRDRSPEEADEEWVTERAEISDEELRAAAATSVRDWEIIPSGYERVRLRERLQELSIRLDRALLAAEDNLPGDGDKAPRGILREQKLLEAILTVSEQDAAALMALPQIHVARKGALPRIGGLAESYLSTTGGIWSAESLRVYLEEAQRHHPLQLEEVLALPQVLKIAALEFVLNRAEEQSRLTAQPGPQGVGGTSFSSVAMVATALRRLRRMNEYDWNELLESAVCFDSVLRQDPGGAFAKMDFETRASYRRRVAYLARHADFNELETAFAAIELARQAKASGDPDPRRAQRVQHVGYYLFAEGRQALEQRIGYHPPAAERARRFLRRHNDDFYLTSIISVSLLLIIPIIAPLVPHHDFWLVMSAMLMALLPVSQGAVNLVNGIVSSLLSAEALPKMDCAKGVPEDSTTLVVVPTLILNEKQVRELFEDLEARYLSNGDPHIHFALLTDLPDTSTQPAPDERHPLVKMAVRWTDDLNAKYANSRGGSFLLLHRHRVYNGRQGVWMGWERKRGKLLDLNKLLLGDFDSFPIKAGPLQVLDRVRYVITLDSDTKLPFDAAARLIGAISHPLNRAVVDPRLRIVTLGYGILQPRVGVSVASASRSRLAAIYSGETGFDPYTRAVSDVYQDLFGEGSFTGKGIYEVSVLHHVLERRFPRNALLSHDLIEGAYVRAGLATDIEVIDDYPSQYHAHTRRIHRWIRGDWQILRWLFSPVPDETGRMVQNPISSISRWKILDNLRRSLVEPITFLVLALGWFLFPGGPLYWTGVTIALLLLPAQVKLAFDLGNALYKLNGTAASEALAAFGRSLAVAGIDLTFLAHQMMLTLDAVVRSLTRSLLSGRRLLEWETAAEAESNVKRSSLDTYLQLSPLVALLMALSLLTVRPSALLAAGPVLLLWAVAPLVVIWLNAPPKVDGDAVTSGDRAFLEQQVLRIWRFYADFAGPMNHWLVPDHVEEKGLSQVRLLTPTNLGMLLNARQAAGEFGLLTLPEMAETMLGSLASFERMEKYRGHIYNWYDLETLRPILPVEVSTVDSGNLAAAFFTLHTGMLELIRRPLLCQESFFPCKYLVGGSLSARRRAAARSSPETKPLTDCLQELFIRPADPAITPTGAPFEHWLHDEQERRRAALASFIEGYLPWLLPQFGPLTHAMGAQAAQIPSLEQAPAYLVALCESLSAVTPGSSLHGLAQQLRELAAAALTRLTRLHQDLKSVSDQAERYAESMDFGFLFVESRQLLSNGYDLATNQLHASCFDLLASEARMAAFLAVAKGDIPQQSWFRLNRAHVLVKGRATLLSWTATMFEYLMPALWMQPYPGTLLSNTLDGAIQIQIDHAQGMPWGISESGFASCDETGRYGYQAWGIPVLALKYRAQDGPVISPYSTFLALPLAPRPALANLRRMAAMGWIGEYGFYEAADYTKSPERKRQATLVRSWMAHHQGMSLLALTNFLRDNVVRTWFHANPRVRAAERLLHERPLRRETLRELAERAA